VEEELLRLEKKDFFAGDVKEFMCFAIPPPALPVRFTVLLRGGKMGCGCGARERSEDRSLCVVVVGGGVR
jgi:hypothetical protein